MADTTDAWSKAWNDVQTLRPIIETERDKADRLRRLPDTIADAFIARDIYRLMLPVELGGAGITPLQQFDLTLEVSRIDASTGWNYTLAMESASLAGVLPLELSRRRFATADCGGAGSGRPQGRAVMVDGGCRVTGRWSWASGLSQARNVLGGCVVFEDDAPKLGPDGVPIIVHVSVPIEQAEVFDTWKTGGMRGTGSADFALNDVFVPTEQIFTLFGGEPTLADPLFHLPVSAFGFTLTAVPLGVAMSVIENLKEVAVTKRHPPPRATLAEEAETQFTVAKAEASVEAAALYVRDAFTKMWEEVCAGGESSMESRARLRRAMVHAVDTAIEAVSACYRAAGGSAVFESAPFERALRDVYTMGAHHVFQRSMMEDAGRVSMGLEPTLRMF
jgi:alkylation response protein AidB-like acyl-CoA dehydrogenase